jgi:predicted secreted protein
MVIVDATFNRRVVRAAVGDLLRLELPENVSTGNRWSLPDPLPQQLRLVLDKTPTEQNVSYAAGERRLEFRIIASGTFALSLLNVPSWQQAPTSFELFVEAYEAEPDAFVGPASSPL